MAMSKSSHDQSNKARDEEITSATELMDPNHFTAQCSLQESIEEIIDRLDITALIANNADDSSSISSSGGASVTSSGGASDATLSAGEASDAPGLSTPDTASCTGSEVGLVSDNTNDMRSSPTKVLNDKKIIYGVNSSTVKTKQDCDSPGTQNNNIFKTNVENHTQKKSKNNSPMKILRRMSQKVIGDKDRHSSMATTGATPAGHAGGTGAINASTLADVAVDALPQAFVTKYLGARPCSGLWGITHTRSPVDQMIDAVGKMKSHEDLALVQLHVSRRGLYLAPHPRNRAADFSPCLVPIEFISYGVQDNVYSRVFAFIVVKEMSSEEKVLECHAYVCDSAVTSRRLALSLALAFQEFAEKIKGKNYRFQVDLRNRKQLNDELLEGQTDGEC